MAILTEDLICKTCGRDYTDDEDIVVGNNCIAEDCPDNDITNTKYVEPRFWELQLTGFKAGTSETDNLLIWVRTESREQLDIALDGVSQHIIQFVIIEDDMKDGNLDYEDGIDAKLPEDAEKLRELILNKLGGAK